jgi:hypothetical protein
MLSHNPPSRAEQNALRRQALATGLNRAARRAQRSQGLSSASSASAMTAEVQQQQAATARPRTPGTFSADCGELRRGEQAERPVRWRS